MNAKILIVDDQKDLLDLLTMSLSPEGYQVRTALNAAEAISAIRLQKPDLILLDILLPDISGVRLTTRLKNDAETADIPVILLTAKDSETDIIVGLSVGADDYITKPFSIKVLLARMEAVLRRAYPQSKDVKQVISSGLVRIFPAARQVFVEGQPVELTGAEFAILMALINANGTVLSRDELGKTLQNSPDAGGSERVVDVHVAALRKKLGKARNFVKTIHGQGYRAVL
ncbi:MAG: response regulator transcription factor [Planctomycetes bacterium]|nr:response regulator transcription factor [Planctomycetota bacterium]